MAKSTLERRYSKTTERLTTLEPLLKSHDRVVLLDENDELMRFNRDFPFHPLNRVANFKIYALLRPNTIQIQCWRQDFASLALGVWKDHGDIWISRRPLSPKPAAAWNWVEGDDRRISWADLKFFSKLDMGASIAGDDGFNLLLPSRNNLDFLEGVLSPARQETGLRLFPTCDTP